MNQLTTSPILVIILAILYIVFSIIITKYILSNGKNEKQIIEENKLKAVKAKSFLKKYPEANMKSARKFSLAFGFIFAFATSIYAFSLLGEAQTNCVLPPLLVDSAFVIQIQRPITTEKSKTIKKKVPPPPPTADFKIVTKTNPEPPEIIDPEPIFVPEDKDVIFEPKIEVPIDEPELFVVVEKMPRFKGCEGLTEAEADICTRNKVKEYLYRMEYPQDAYNYDIEGKVDIGFVVNEKGKVVDVEILRSADKVFNNDVLKHLKKMPNFASAGKQRGKKVLVKYHTAIVFKLN